MLGMFLQMGLYVAAATLIIYLVYTLFLSSATVGPAVAADQKKYRRLERRQTELGARRKQSTQPPQGVERRLRKRRATD